MGWNEEALRELDLIQGFPKYLLRQVYQHVLYAKAYVNLGKFSSAASSAEEALLVAQEVHSEVNIARIATIHRQLMQCAYKNSPDVAHLDYLLHYKPRT